MSPLEERLRRTAASEVPTEAAVARADLAALLARTGRDSECQALIKALRDAFGAGTNHRISLRIMVAEGLLTYFRALDPSARDRLRRAQGLAVALGDHDVAACSSAWLAHIAFDESDYAALSTQILQSLDHCSPNSHQALGRSALTLANAHCFVGMLPEAKLWFFRAHACAVAEGDSASIGALIHNRAALKVGLLRLAHSQGVDCAAEARSVELELDSSINYDRLSRVDSLPFLSALWKARLLLMKGDAPAARGLLEQHVDAVQVEGLKRMTSSIKADYLLASASSLDVAEREEIETICISPEAFCTDRNPDDRAIFFYSIATLAKAIGQAPDVVNRLETLGHDARAEHESVIGRLRQTLEALAIDMAAEKRAALWPQTP